MVTLLGFACILANVACLEIFMPDLVGPVGLSYLLSDLPSSDVAWEAEKSPRVRHGSIIALPWDYGCEARAGDGQCCGSLGLIAMSIIGTRLWITSMGSKLAEQGNPVVWESYSSTF